MKNSHVYDQHAPFTPRTLQADNRAFRDSGGVSAGNRTLGFRPAFKDRSSGRVYLSRFADGRPAPIHVLEGLPESLMEARDGSAGNTVIKNSVIAGFVLANTFYTREQAANAVASQAMH